MQGLQAHREGTQCYRRRPHILSGTPASSAFVLANTSVRSPRKALSFITKQLVLTVGPVIIESL